ncbi:hypothetical protein ACUJ7Q_005139, partial [Escherichia coli]
FIFVSRNKNSKRPDDAWVQPNTGAHSSTFGVPENMQSVLSNADELLLIHLTKEKRSESLVCLNIQQNPQGVSRSVPGVYESHNIDRDDIYEWLFYPMVVLCVPVNGGLPLDR